MSVFMTGTTLNATSCEIHHQQSGAVIRTTAPKDNGGDGSSFSPTDLCAASLATCASTILSMFASKNQIPLEKVEFSVEKQMIATPRKISKLVLNLNIFTKCSESDFEKLVVAAKTCPVRLSIHADIIVEEVYKRA